MTPLGRSVVPDVYMRRNRSSGVRGLHLCRGRRPGKAGAVLLRYLLDDDRIGNSPRRRSELGIAEEQPRAGVLEDVADLVGGESVVDRQRHGAEVAPSKRQLDEG